MAALGLMPEDYEDEATPIWPENWAVVQFFADLPIGVWNMGPAGASGLRPEALREVRVAMGIPLKQWREWWPDVMVMEGEAVKVMAEEREKALRRD